MTTKAAENIAPYHDRMPVVLSVHNSWLAADHDPLNALSMLPPEEVAIRPVNTAVNRVAEKNLSVIESKATGDLFSNLQ